MNTAAPSGLADLINAEQNRQSIDVNKAIKCSRKSIERKWFALLNVRRERSEFMRLIAG